MQYLQLVGLLLVAVSNTAGQPCRICGPESPDRTCFPQDAMTPPEGVVIQSSICSDVENNHKDYHNKLCEKYPKPNGYYFECTSPGTTNTFSCRSSCGPPLEDVGKGLNLDLLQGGGLFATLNQNRPQNRGAGLFDFANFNNDKSRGDTNFGQFATLGSFNLLGNQNAGGFQNQGQANTRLGTAANTGRTSNAGRQAGANRGGTASFTSSSSSYGGGNSRTGNSNNNVGFNSANGNNNVGFSTGNSNNVGFKAANLAGQDGNKMLNQLGNAVMLGRGGAGSRNTGLSLLGSTAGSGNGAGSSSGSGFGLLGGSSTGRSSSGGGGFGSSSSSTSSSSGSNNFNNQLGNNGASRSGRRSGSSRGNDFGLLGSNNAGGANAQDWFNQIGSLSNGANTNTNNNFKNNNAFNLVGAGTSSNYKPFNFNTNNFGVPAGFNAGGFGVPGPIGGGVSDSDFNKNFDLTSLKPVDNQESFDAFYDNFNNNFQQGFDNLLPEDKAGGAATGPGGVQSSSSSLSTSGTSVGNKGSSLKGGALGSQGLGSAGAQLAAQAAALKAATAGGGSSGLGTNAGSASSVASGVGAVSGVDAGGGLSAGSALNAGSGVDAGSVVNTGSGIDAGSAGINPGPVGINSPPPINSAPPINAVAGGIGPGPAGINNPLPINSAPPIGAVASGINPASPSFSPRDSGAYGSDAINPSGAQNTPGSPASDIAPVAALQGAYRAKYQGVLQTPHTVNTRLKHSRGLVPLRAAMGTVDVVMPGEETPQDSSRQDVTEMPMARESTMPESDGNHASTMPREGTKEGGPEDSVDVSSEQETYGAEDAVDVATGEEGNSVGNAMQPDTHKALPTQMPLGTTNMQTTGTRNTQALTTAMPMVQAAVTEEEDDVELPAGGEGIPAETEKEEHESAVVVSIEDLGPTYTATMSLEV